MTRLGLGFKKALNILNTKAARPSANLPVKIGAFLVGFFQATALSTVIGQTGDWDVLVSGALVALAELLGALVYSSHNYIVPNIRLNSNGSRSKRTKAMLKGYIQALNCLKMGLVYGLFVDAFKLGS
uniref:hypothetical chloroplast RF20 n=1 Tax=Streptosarcina arenaria TaxID=2058782 RepID=UPI00286C7D76|nr:hypothetical chloroplast RF20 [Streptosarcina arenaria]WKT08864.1 hypothetical chloroplast RF20 [Streptosarcina arenaria]